MLLLKPFVETQGWSILLPCGIVPFTPFRYAFEFFHSKTRILDRLLGPCFKTGQQKPFWQNHISVPQARLPFSIPQIQWVVIPAAWTSFCLSTVKKFLSPVHLRLKCFDVTLRRSYRTLVTTARSINCSSTASFSTVSSLLTLFSKFFSSFLRSTCSLSVSRLYLALEEVYLPFRAAFPNNPTLWLLSYVQEDAYYGAFTLFGAVFQPTYASSMTSDRTSRLQFFNCTLKILTLSFCRFTRRY